MLRKRFIEDCDREKLRDLAGAHNQEVFGKKWWNGKA